MRQISPSPAGRFEPINRRARLIWLLILVGAPLLMAGAMIIAINAGNLEMDEPLVPSSMAYPAMIGGCILLLLTARGITGFIMQPERLTKLNLTQSGASLPDTPEGEAVLRVQTGTFILLAILDLPIVAGLALGFMNWDIQFLLLAMGYGVLVSAVAMPDFGRIAAATEQGILQRDGKV